MTDHLTRWTLGIVSLVLVFCLPAIGAGKTMSWDVTEDHIALKRNGQILWQFNVAKGDYKPCFHPLATAEGIVLSDFRPADHKHHRAAWFSPKFINGVNYWEENKGTGLSAGRTEVTDIQIERRDDFSAAIRLTMSYHLPGQQELIAEERLIRVSPPDKEGYYLIDWQHLLTAREKVVLERTPLPHQPGGSGNGGYAGLSLRLSKATVPWAFLDSEGRKKSESHGQTARWLSFGGDTPKGSGAVTFFDHPSNLRHPTRWFIVQHMPYFSPAFIFSDGVMVEEGESLSLYYRLKIHARQPAAKSLDADWKAFAASKFELAEIPPKYGKVDLVDIGRKIVTEQCQLCHVTEPGATVAGTAGQVGPQLYGLLSAEERSRPVVHREKIMEVKVNGAYILSSLQWPALNLAVNEDGVPYPNAMPPFELTEQQRRGILAYLRTLNPQAQRGRAQVWVDAEAVDFAVQDAHNVVVGERPRIVRAAFSDVSTRSIAVGLPGGRNYIFDTSTLSVGKAWIGGFINLEAERTNRGKGVNQMDRDTLELKLGKGLRPMGVNGFVDLSYKDYPTDPSSYEERLQQELNNSTPFLARAPKDNPHFLGYELDKAGHPIFLFSINSVHFRQRTSFVDEHTLRFDFAVTGARKPLRFAVDTGSGDYSSEVGSIKDGILTVPATSKEFSVTLRFSGGAAL